MYDLVDLLYYIRKAQFASAFQSQYVCLALWCVIHVP